MSPRGRPAQDRSTEGLDADTLPKLALQHARRRGARPAIREKSRGIWRTMTWGELAEEACALAAALAERGVKRGAHVALVGDNRPRLYAAMSAAQWLGAVAVPLYQDATSAEMATPLQSAQATHVFAENQQQVDKLLEILPHCPSLRCIIYDDDRGMRHYRQRELVSYEALLQQGRALAHEKRDWLHAELARGTGSDIAFLFFTSGTTGPAKGVVLTYASLIDRARVAALAERLEDTDVAMAYLPLGWIGQNLFCYTQPMVVGYCICCPESSDTLLADMREMGPTYFLGPPRVLEALRSQVSLRVEDAGALMEVLFRHSMAHARRVGARILSGEPVGLLDRFAYAVYDLLIYAPLRDVLGMSRIRVAFTGGDAVDPGLMMFFRSIGINLKQLYGSTETGFIVAMQRDGRVRPDAAGPVADGVEVRSSARQEILVRSPGLFREYHRDPETTKRSMNGEGWFHTGDAGSLGEDGQLRVIDRLENVSALSDGTLLAPRVIENKLKFYPYIREAVAFGNGRDRVCVMVDIDPAAVGRWADKRGVSYAGHADLAARDEVSALIADCIGKVNAELALEPGMTKSQIHRFLILAKELDADDGLLTRTGKLRRGAIAERYGPLVDALYGGTASAELKILDAKVYA
jgi:long-chain acyl-CoA synthetase